jgi:hypothetical protein
MFFQHPRTVFTFCIHSSKRERESSGKKILRLTYLTNASVRVTEARMPVALARDASAQVRPNVDPGVAKRAVLARHPLVANGASTPLDSHRPLLASVPRFGNVHRHLHQPGCPR